MSIVDPFLVSKLIELIRGNRCIYDPRHEQHNNRAVINSIWKSIASEMGQPETLCREKWINLRSNFARELRKTRRKMFEGGSISGGSQWVHFEAMTFLAPFVKTRLATMENMATEVDDMKMVRIKVERDTTNDSESMKSTTFRNDGAGGDESDLSLSSIHESTQSRKRKYYGTSSVVEDETDDDKLFLLSLLPKLKQLPILENLSFRVEVHTLLLSKLQAVLCHASSTALSDERFIRGTPSSTHSYRNVDDVESSSSES